ncbi:MAG: TPM domain-containing protein, partial [Microscillaceae bacterium]|nr:TPM domain-containing protein [Microscillaceae bacterium]
MKKYRLRYLLICWGLGLALWSQKLTAQNFFVQDEASMLSVEDRNRLEQMLKSYQDSTSTQIGIFTVASLGGQSIEAYSVALATRLGIGQKGKDNGLLILLAREERKVRIEVGYGLEAILTDLVCKRLIEEVMSPQFRQGKFGAGLEQALEKIFKLLSGEFTGADLEPPRPWMTSPDFDNQIFYTFLGQLLLAISFYISSFFIKYTRFWFSLRAYFLLFGPIYLYQAVLSTIMLWPESAGGILFIEVFWVSLFFLLSIPSSRKSGGGGSYSSRGYSSIPLLIPLPLPVVPIHPGVLPLEV